jgi:hypothetical protein
MTRVGSQRHSKQKKKECYLVEENFEVCYEFLLFSKFYFSRGKVARSGILLLISIYCREYACLELAPAVSSGAVQRKHVHNFTSSSTFFEVELIWSNVTLCTTERSAV